MILWAPLLLLPALYINDRGGHSLGTPVHPENVFHHTRHSVIGRGGEERRMKIAVYPRPITEHLVFLHNKKVFFLYGGGAE